MSDFLGKLISNIEKGKIKSDQKNYDLTDAAAISKDSVFLKDNIDFQNTDTIIKRKTTEEEIEEDIIRLFGEQKEIKVNPKTKEIKSMLLKTTGREFEQEELSTFLELNEQQIELAKKIIKEDKNQFFNGEEIATIAKNLKEENFEKAKKLMHMDESIFPFEAIDIAKLSTLNDNQIEVVRKLSSIQERSSQFTGAELFLLAQIPVTELEKHLKVNPNLDVQKLTGTSIAIEEPSNKNSKRTYNVYDTTQQMYVEKRTEEYSDNVRTETILNTQNRIKQIIKTDTTSETIQDEIIFRYDKDWNLISTERLKNSTGILSQNVSKTDTEGNLTPIQWAEKDELTGNTVIQKNFSSYDGTKTEYYYEETTAGIKISEYKITDKKGNILLNERSTFTPDKLDQNKFISTINGNLYEIKHTENEIIIHDQNTDKTTRLNLEDLAEGKPENIIQILKRIPGNYLLQMDKSPIEIKNTEFDVGLWGNEDKILQIGVSYWFSGQEEAFSVFMHELGHFLDTEKNSSKYGIISQNEELTAIYKEELENFKKNSTIKQQEFIDYFIGENDINARAETTAEATMILNTPYSSRRSFYLQQNFPRTIAKIAELTQSEVLSNP